MVPGEATLRRLMAPMREALADPDTREVVVNGPGEFGVETGAGWRWVAAPELTFERLDAIGILAARFTTQDFGPFRPACSSRLPDGERITLARPPVTPAHMVSLTIRKRASSFTPTLEWLEGRGWFSALPPRPGGWPAWLRRQVERKRTIVFTGETGSSKTTAAEACIRAVPPHERIITLESTPEWFGLPHKNWAPRQYAQAGDTKSGLPRAEEALATALRERPDRILFGEMRTGEAWAYLRVLMGGHPGGISTAHAAPGREAAFDTLTLQIRENPHSAGVSDETIRRMLREHVHVVVHCEKRAGDAVPYRATGVDAAPELLAEAVA